jgi:hypothetical protein
MGDAMTATVSEGMSSLEAALALANAGMNVFPIDHPELPRCIGIGQHHDPDEPDHQRGKHPAVAFSHASTTNPKMIATWFTGAPRNIGIHCGPSNLVVIDEDRLGEFKRYADEHQVKIPHTMVVATAKGRHYYFRARDDHPLGNKEGALKGYSINVRGTNGYVVAPGSVHASRVHASRVVYTIEVDLPPAPIPDWVVDAVARTNGSTTSAAVERETVATTEPRGLAAVPDVIRGPRDDRGGERHEVLVRYASSLRARSVPWDEAVTLFRAAWEREQPPICRTPMPWPDALGKLSDIYNRYPEGPSPEYRREPDPVAPEKEPAYQFTLGGSFILDTDPAPRPLWGEGDQVLWADGESVIIDGPQGVGKTTIAQQLALARAGFDEYSELLGFPIVSGQHRVLYLAMDRPKQAARSFRRMVGEAWRSELNDRLIVWQGPPPYLARHPSVLLKMCEQAAADTVFVDSLKDAAIGLTDDEVGASYNRARQTALAAGIQVAELHHNRKALSGAKAERPTIDDVYGSVWLTSGAGSVILLNGAPGDPIVSLHHLKQPADEVGPLKVIHNQETGQSQIWHALDLVLLATQPGGVTAIDAAKALFETDKPTAAEKEKARRRLGTLTKKGLLQVVDPGDTATSRPQRWGSK